MDSQTVAGVLTVAGGLPILVSYIYIIIWFLGCGQTIRLRNSAVISANRSKCLHHQRWLELGIIWCALFSQTNALLVVLVSLVEKFSLFNPASPLDMSLCEAWGGALLIAYPAAKFAAYRFLCLLGHRCVTHEFDTGLSCEHIEKFVEGDVEWTFFQVFIVILLFRQLVY